MSETLLVIGVVLFAVLLGVMIPVLFSLRSAAMKINKLIDKTDQPLYEIVRSANHSAKHVEGVLAEFEQHRESVGEFLVTVNDFAGTIHQANRTLKASMAVGAAVGPMISAFISTWKEQHAENIDDDDASSANGEPRQESQESSSPDATHLNYQT